MVEARSRLGLALEAPRRLLDLSHLGVQKLESHHLLHQDMLGSEHRPHAALADAPEHPVALAHHGAHARIARSIRHLGGGHASVAHVADGQSTIAASRGHIDD